jgi:hypothetical protein
MVTKEELLKMSNDELAARIAVQQQETTLMFQVMASRMTSKTKGGRFLSNDSVDIATYWLKVGIEHPEIIAAICDVNDFGTKALFFSALVGVTDRDETISNILKTPRDIASKDCYWYVSYIKKRVQELETDPIFKMILQKEPSVRTSPSVLDKANKAAEKAQKAADKAAEKATLAAEKALSKANKAAERAAVATAKMAQKVPIAAT